MTQPTPDALQEARKIVNDWFDADTLDVIQITQTEEDALVKRIAAALASPASPDEGLREELITMIERCVSVFGYEHEGPERRIVADDARELVALARKAPASPSDFNPDANKVCDLNCPFDLSEGHLIRDHPVLPPGFDALCEVLGDEDIGDLEANEIMFNRGLIAGREEAAKALEEKSRDCATRMARSQSMFEESGFDTDADSACRWGIEAKVYRSAAEIARSLSQPVVTI